MRPSYQRQQVCRACTFGLSRSDRSAPCVITGESMTEEECTETASALRCHVCHRSGGKGPCVYGKNPCPIRQVSQSFRALKLTCQITDPSWKIDDLWSLLNAMRRLKVPRPAGAVTAIRKLRKLRDYLQDVPVNQIWHRLSFLHPEEQPFHEDRLFPLPAEAYDEWARQVWVQRGSPNFRKRIISGIRFGKPVLNTGKFFRTIQKRLIGVFPRRFCGRIRVEVKCPDAME